MNIYISRKQKSISPVHKPTVLRSISTSICVGGGSLIAVIIILLWCCIPCASRICCVPVATPWVSRLLLLLLLIIIIVGWCIPTCRRRHRIIISLYVLLIIVISPVCVRNILIGIPSYIPRIPYVVIGSSRCIGLILSFPLGWLLLLWLGCRLIVLKILETTKNIL